MSRLATRLLRSTPKLFGLLAVVVLAVLFVVQPGRAAINKQVNFQARLTDPSGNIVADGDYNIEFKLMTVASGGDTTQGSCTTSCVWIETRTGANKVTVSRGLFAIQLGSVSSLSSVDFNQNLYLSVRIGGIGTPSWDPEMSPRHQLGAAPTAILADNALNLNGQAASYYLNASNLSSGTLADARLSSNVPLKNAANVFTSTNTFQAASTTAFLIQKASGTDTVFTSDTTNNRVIIGNATAAAASDNTLLIVDSATTALLPTGVNGGIIYDSTTNKFKVFENGAYKTLCNTTDLGCGTGGAVTLQNAYDGGNSITTTNNRNLSITLADTATDSNFLVNVATGSSSTFKVQNNGTDVLSIGSAGQLALSVSGSSGGLLIGGDTNLYRYSADRLQTDDAFFVSRGFSYNTAFAAYVSGDTNARYNVNADGSTSWGSGSATQDTQLSRTGVGSLTVQSLTNSTTAFQVQNAAGTAIVTANTSGGALTISGTDTGRLNLDRNAVGTRKSQINFTQQGAARYSLGIDAADNNTNDFWIYDEVATATRLAISATGLVGIGGPAANGQLTVGTNTTAASGGIYFGTDTNLYRSAADTLKTDDSFVVGTNLQVDGNSTLGNATSDLITINGQVVAGGTATGTTATTSGTGTNTTTVTLTGSAFANNDVILIDNAGQDYYTRIVSGGGTATLTVSPAVTFETGRTVTKYNIQNIGATTSDYTTLGNRFFQGYFLGGVVTGAGTTTLSDNRLLSTGTFNFNSAAYTFKNSADSTTAFQIQNAAGTSLLTADTTNNRITVGSGTLLTVGTGTLPTGVNGGIFYDSSANKFKIYENGAWKILCNTTDAGCGAGGATTLQTAYDNSSAPATITTANAKDLLFTLSDTATDSNFRINVATGSTSKFAVQNNSVDTFSVSATGAVLSKNSTNSTTAFQIQNAAGTTTIFNIDTTNAEVEIAANSALNFDGSGGTTSVAYASGSKSLTFYNGNAAGNIYFQSENFYLQDTIGYNNNLTITNTGATTFKNRVNSTTAFRIQNAAGTSLFNVSTSGGEVTIGSDIWLNFGSSDNRIFNDSATNNFIIGQFNNADELQLQAASFSLKDPANSFANVFSVTNGGKAVFQNASDSTTAFRVQSASGANVFTVRTDSVGSGYAVVNVGGSGVSYSQLDLYQGTTRQWGIGTDDSSLGGTDGFYLYNVQSGVGSGQFALTSNGAAIFRNNANTTGGFQVQNAAGANLFNIDTTNNVVDILPNNPGALQTWNSTTALGSGRQYTRSAILNGYLYRIAGSSASIQSDVEYAKINTNGTIGSWTVTSSLPAARDYHAVTTANGYVYVVGGSSVFNGGSAVSTVYYAKANSDGTLGSWQTGTSLPANMMMNQAFTANGYIYSIGNNSTTGYYAPLNADGSVGSWTTQANLAPAARNYPAIAVANGYVYFMGGDSGGGVSTTNTYYAPLNSNGAIGTWTSTTALPAARSFANAAVANGYVYFVGGFVSGTTDSQDVYYAQLNANGTIGSWTTQATALPGARDSYGLSVYNGYIYVVGGSNGNNTAQTTVYYASTPRVRVAGALDLVGLAGQNVADPGTSQLGSSGGELTAGNTNIVGNLTVQGQATFNQGVAIDGVLNATSSAVFKNDTNTTTAFQIQNASGYQLFNVDTATTSNLITNPGFEINTTGWAAKGTATIARNTANSYSGVASLSVNPSATNSGASFNYTFSATTQYTLSVFVKASGANFSTFDIGRQDNGSDIDCFNPDVTAYTAGWMRYTCTFTTGGTISGSNIYVKQTDATNRTWYVDAVQLVAGANTQSYNPGGQLALRGLIASPLNVQNKEDSSSALLVSQASGAPVLSVSTLAGATPVGITVGSSSSDANAVLLTLDSYNTSTDPTGQNGAMYYNAAAAKFRCYENSVWKDCDVPTLRSNWFMYDDFTTNTITAGTGADLGNIGDLNWTFVSIGATGSLSKVDVGADASDQGRNGVMRLNSIATAGVGVSLRLDNTGIAGTPAGTTVEWDFGPANAAAATQQQVTIRIGLHDSTTSASPTDGIYFQYNVTTTAGNWFRCARNNSTETCTDTGIAATTTLNQYQRFKMVINSSSVDYYINEASAGSISGGSLPAAGRSYGPAINMNTVDATVRQYKMDYFQVRRTNITR